MYLPKHFQADADQTTDLLAQIRVADLITPPSDGLFGTFLPLIHERPPADGRFDGAVAGLRSVGDQRVADAMEHARAGR